MINSKNVNTSISYITSGEVIKKYYDKLAKKEFDNIKSVKLEELKNEYYTQYKEENITNTIPQSKWEKYSKAEDVESFVKLKLVKGSYKDVIISLRYKNDIPQFIDTMELTVEYSANLRNKGYKEKKVSDSKIIYENEEYQIIIMKEFDYLVIVMVKL